MKAAAKRIAAIYMRAGIAVIIDPVVVTVIVIAVITVIRVSVVVITVIGTRVITIVDVMVLVSSIDSPYGDHMSLLNPDLGPKPAVVILGIGRNACARKRYNSKQPDTKYIL